MCQQWDQYGDETYHALGVPFELPPDLPDSDRPAGEPKASYATCRRLVRVLIITFFVAQDRDNLTRGT